MGITQTQIYADKCPRPKKIVPETLKASKKSCQEQIEKSYKND